MSDKHNFEDYDVRPGDLLLDEAERFTPGSKCYYLVHSLSDQDGGGTLCFVSCWQHVNGTWLGSQTEYANCGGAMAFTPDEVRSLRKVGRLEIPE